jgi:hypothetical protein
MEQMEALVEVRRIQERLDREQMDKDMTVELELTLGISPFLLVVVVEQVKLVLMELGLVEAMEEMD